MSACSIEIVLDRGSEPYHSGETITGHLIIVPYEEVDAKELKIVFCWKTHGSGNVDSEIIDTIAFDPPSWAPNQKQEVPFTFSLPSTPVSHTGTLVNVEWSIEAGLNRGWFRNDRTERSILVLPNASRPAEIPTQQHIETISSTPLKNGWILPVALMVSPIGGVTALYFTDSFAWLSDETASIIPFAVITLIEFICFTVGVFLFLRWRSRSQKIGSVSVNIEEGTITNRSSEGKNAVSIELTHRPSGALQVKHVDMYLSYRELAWSGAGTNRTSKRIDNRIRTERVGSGLTLLPGQLFKEQAVLELPREPSPSFRSADNEVAWVAGVELEIEGFPTLRYEQGLWIY